MKRAALNFALLCLFAASAEAQTKPRWRLDFTHEKPTIFTYRNSLGQLENFWYVSYTLTNKTDEIVPLLVTVLLYTDTGKDLQHDVGKVDPEPTKEALENPRRNEPLKFGRFYADVVVPQDVEYAIIEAHAKLGNRSPGIVRESIEELKRGFTEEATAPDVRGMWNVGDRFYLNAREMRQQRFIKPGQKLQGIAIFQDVDPRTRVIELHVAGLWDVVRIDGYDPEEVRLHYETRFLKVTYDFKGDEFERESDVLIQTRREEVVKALGPIASKDTLRTMVDTLLARLKLEERWASQEVPPEEAEKERKLEQLTPLDMAIAARVVRLASGKDFGYDPTKSILENKAAIWRLHEWWVTNSTRLVYNEATGRFDIRNEKLPGQQD